MSNTATTRPTHRAYLITGEGDNRYWRELGPVWSHKDGNGFTFVPHVLPAPGESITIRKITPKKGAAAAASETVAHGEVA